MPPAPFLPTSAQPYPALLDAYPCPAFIVRTQSTLRPVWANRAYNAAFGVPGILLKDSFVHALSTTDDGQNYGMWSMDTSSEPRLRLGKKRSRGFSDEVDVEQFTTAPLTVRMRLAGGEGELRLVKTRVEDMLIMISTLEFSTPPSPMDISPAPAKRFRDNSFTGTLVPLPPLKVTTNHRLLTPEDTPVLPSAFSDTSSSATGPWPFKVPHTLGAVVPGPSATATQALFESHPWEKTPLGDRSTWSERLRSAVNIMQTSPHAMIGHKHPYLYGQRASVGWAELWEILGPQMSSLTAGKALSKTDDLLFFDALTPDKLPMETYHTWVWIPCADEAGHVHGILNYSIETTSKVIASRRLDCLRELGSSGMRAATQAEYYQTALETFEQYPHDVPFAMFYSINAEPIAADLSSNRDQSSIASTTDGHSSPRTVTINAQCTGVVGIPTDHHTAPQNITFTIPHKRNTPSPRFFTGPTAGLGLLDFNSADAELKLDAPASTLSIIPPDFASDLESGDNAGFRWAPFIKQCMTTGQPVLVDLPEHATSGMEKRGWGEHARQALVVPIIAGSGGVEVGYGLGTCKAVLILGVNSRRPYDSEYEGWIDVVGSSLGQMYMGVTAREADFLRAEQLAQLDAAKTHFFSNASHELRTPLTLISGPISDAINEATCPRSQERLKLVMRNVNRLRRLVDTLMDFSRVEAGRLEGHFRPLKLGQVTADLAALFRSTIEKSGIKYAVDCDSTSSQLTYVDPELWEKIVFNIVGNAFKYTLNGKITVAVKHHDDCAVFSVSDTGVGIPEQDRQKITERFHRVAELVRLHGGTLAVESKVSEASGDEHGSTFSVRVPLGRAHLPDSHVYEEQHEHVSSFFGRDWSYARTFVEEVTQWASQSDSTPQTPSDGPDSLPSITGPRVDPAIYFSKSDKILIADDNGDMRAYMRQIFSKFCTVLVANDGVEALEIARKEVPNLILSDVMMPGLDGFQLIAALRSSNETTLIPVILVTAQAGVEGRVEGADDVICKPFQSRELLARANLHTQLGKRRVELETKFNERTEELKIVTESSPVAFFRINSDREVVFANAMYYELTGQARDLGSNDWAAAAKQGHSQAIMQLWESAQYERKGGSINFQCNNEVWVKAQLVPTSLGIVGTLTDISAQKMLEESKLAHARESEMNAKRRAEEADERRRAQDSKLVAALEDDIDSLDAVMQCGLAQERIANDVLSLSRIQLEVLAIHPTEFLLADEVQNIVSIFKNETKMKNIQLSVVLGESLTKYGVTTVFADKARFAQIVTNLCSNAIRFTDLVQGERRIVITVDVSPSAPSEGSALFVYVSVADSGPGVHPDDVALLFKRFQQGTNSHEVFGGSGLGLFVSRQLATLMGGRIDVSSEIGRGATFRFFVGATLPKLMKSDGTGHAETTSAVPRRIKALRRPNAAKDPRHTGINQSVLNRQLTKAGCVTTLASNGLEAIERICSLAQHGDTRLPPTHRSFDVILMDLEMPVMDGLTAVQEIRKLESAGSLPRRNFIVAITGNAREGHRQSAVDAGMDMVFVKPYKIDEILEQIASVRS
ncbi:multi-sensor signal transduction histidine kinase [Rhizoctonia solani AG-1 IB]|uniref:Multi-sensor signal transduction histidine kinase n=1 Tax=Thanatephorus cucumeris (strain AG1-IB / isolate 7/3/14) TaxID=1108050 RepID=M5BS47_THACB|nr:multi-sensor signal transduction histidine kinase [Rhizoctonia solani AG-1 IB]